jgi:hypothetical protein
MAQCGYMKEFLGRGRGPAESEKICKEEGVIE